MKYIITESQYLKMRFARRMGQVPYQYVKDSYAYNHPCEFQSFHHWIQKLIDVSIQNWMELEDLDYITDYIQGDMWDELYSYFNQKCKEDQLG